MGQKFEDGYGVVKNVGVLKSLSITVYGSNYPNGLGVVVSDQDGKEQTLFMDYLQFDGWRTLTWNNPNYITDVRNRELRRYPLYPAGMPYLKLIGLVIYRDAAQQGGDIVTYFKDISITYDKALISTQRDINDEAVWGILQQRQEARRLAEVRRLGNIQVLRFLEKEKMDAGQQGTTQQPAAGATGPPSRSQASTARVKYGTHGGLPSGKASCYLEGSLDAEERVEEGRRGERELLEVQLERPDDPRGGKGHVRGGHDLEDAREWWRWRTGT